MIIATTIVSSPFHYRLTNVSKFFLLIENAIKYRLKLSYLLFWGVDREYYTATPTDVYLFTSSQKYNVIAAC